jgi:DNA-binding FadR family transcriptional regulator
MSIMFAGTEQAIRNMSVARHKVIVDAIASGDPEAGCFGGPRAHGSRRQ